MSGTSLKCFVASAFGKSDVDIIFNKCLRPVLRNNLVQALRVDVVEHNDDIDDKIFQLIDSAAIVIADLTYARPSVYFEAGYAIGKGIPVIFIARKDHFKAKDSDPEGLLRVHFDLQMKNIISWDESHSAFEKRLQRRLNHILRPLRKRQVESEVLTVERRKFVLLSHDDQRVALTKSMVRLGKARGFRVKEAKTRNREYSTIELFKGKSGSRTHVILWCETSPRKKFFDQIQFGSWTVLSPHLFEAKQLHCIVASIKPTPPSLVAESLSDFTPLPVTDAALQGTSLFRKGETFVHILSGHKSEVEFASAFQSVIDRIDAGK